MVTEKGFVPKKNVRVPVNANPYSKEFGATWAMGELTQDIHEKLKKHFREDADWLYVTAMIRCIKHCALRHTEHFYDVSFLFEKFPGLHLSSATLSNRMTGLRFRRATIVNFMRDFITEKGAYMLLDGTTMVCNSANIWETQRGYNRHGCRDQQLSLMNVRGGATVSRATATQ